MGCIFKDELCPVTCKANEKKCFVYDFAENEDFLGTHVDAPAKTCACRRLRRRCCALVLSPRSSATSETLQQQAKLLDSPQFVSAGARNAPVATTR